MVIFKAMSFYLAMTGIILAVVFSYISSRPSPVSSFQTPPSQAPYHNYIAATGIVESIDKNIEIGVPQQGLVEFLWHKVGDQVEAGTPLFQLDSRELEAQLLTQEADLKVETANMEKTKDLIERVKSVRDPRSISQEEIQTREDDYLIAKAKVQSISAKILQTQTLIDRLIVRAPKNGVILQLNIRVGEYVTNSAPAMILGDLTHLQMRIDIDEQNAGYFNVNDKAVAFPRNNTKIKIPLKFVRVEPYVIPKKSLTGLSGERVDTRVLQVIYSFEPPKDYHMYVGQLADAFIEKKI